MSKEVLMSRRPGAMDSVDAARHSVGGGGGGGYQPPPISNYKGVMLCDRPATKAAGRANVDSGMPMPFAAAVGPGSKYEALGLNPSRENRAAKLASDNKMKPVSKANDFLSRHKQWLNRLNQQRQRKAHDEQEQVHVAVEKTKRFKEYAAKLRSNIREARHQHDGGYEEDMGMSSDLPRSAPETGAAKKGKAKPVWAMTEEGAEDREDEELEKLLNFASNLDFDQYIEDFEVRNALAAVKDRISELAQGKARAPGAVGQVDLEGDDWKKAFVDGWNQGGEPDDRLGTARSESRLNTARSMRSEGGGEMDDTRSMAGTERGDDVGMDQAANVLNSSRSMRQVHSSRSIRGILERKKGPAMNRLRGIAEVVDVGPTVAPPVAQVYHQEDQGNGKKIKDRKEVDASNLPYLHRNPAI
mmetsp:Transcript_4198/g.10077  ORF Transcript_4198/g.10077 Transcript_4198/m.10077 type:complete len:414 (-) Transcript_4198:63-1304(-)